MKRAWQNCQGNWAVRPPCARTLNMIMPTSTSRSYDFVQVDVFTEHMFGGNPLAVFPRAEGLTGEEMQAIAKEMNLSETTFILPATRPDCAARVRIFTPAQELPFAGHPTIGTSWVLASHGMLPDGATELRLEEGVGPIEVTLEGDARNPTMLWMKHPPATFGPEVRERSEMARSLGLTEDDLLSGAPIVVGSTGLPFLYIPLNDAGAVDRASLNVAELPAIEAISDSQGVFIFAPDGRYGPNRAYSRMFAPHTQDISEDPATGSASGPLAAYLVRHGLVTGEGELRAISEQGTKMGRQSFIHLRVRVSGGEPTSIEIGGSVVPVLTGTLTLGRGE